MVGRCYVLYIFFVVRFCALFVCVLYILCPMSLDCLFLIAPSVFSNVYLIPSLSLCSATLKSLIQSTNAYLWNVSITIPQPSTYQIDNELMHHINIHGNSHYWFGKCISIKSVRVTILLWPIPSLLMQRSGDVCFRHERKMPTYTVTA